MRWILKRLFGRRPAAQQAVDQTAELPVGMDVPSPDDFSWMLPPTTLKDAAAWDRYWHDQLDHGVAGFVHVFCDDGDLVDAMRSNSLKTILCIGNGISQEPRALAWAGFDATALDLSPFATEVARDVSPPAEFLAHLVGERSGGLNGHLEFVVGDLCDASCCPGPYDVVIDRRTLQLYPEADRPAAMRAVANRLASPGIFFSQSHDGGWKPPAPPRHEAEPWFVAEGWRFWRGDVPLKERVAWLFTTTG